MILIEDNVDAPLKSFQAKTSDNIRFIDQQFGLMELLSVFKLASSFDDNELVLLQEDDYLYKPATWPFHSPTTYNELFSQALEYADYVSVYDHPDKYLAPSLGGNKFISHNGVERDYSAQLTRTGNIPTPQLAHLLAQRKLFARILKFGSIFAVRPPIRFSGVYCAWLKGRRLATSIPGRATHTDLTIFLHFREVSLTYAELGKDFDKQI